MQIATSFNQNSIRRLPPRQEPTGLQKFVEAMKETAEGLENIRRGVDSLELNFLGSEKERIQFEAHIVNMVNDRLSQFLTPRFTDSETLFARVSNEDKNEAIEYFTKHVGFYFHECPFGRRTYFKPRGYAGDYEMMNHIYRNQPEGDTLFRRCLNYYTVNLPFSVAVRNRAVLLKDKMVSKIRTLKQGETLNVLSVACGPAKEICDVIAEPGLDFSRVKFVLLDQDEEALAYATAHIEAAASRAGVTVVVEGLPTNVINYVRQRTPEKFDFIYSAGLFDYFSDSIAKLTAKRLFQKLKIGGELFIGNFKSLPFSRMQIELVSDWFLIYRTKEELVSLFSEITPNLEVESEPKQINLFVTMKKDSAASVEHLNGDAVSNYLQ